MKNYKNVALYLLLAILSVFVLSFTQAYHPVSEKPAQYKTNLTKPCKGLDIVFLISYSRSMKYNDNMELRTRAMKTALDIIGDNAIYLCPGYQHRLAIVGFGDEIDPLSDWVDVVPPKLINPKLETLGEWTTQKWDLINSEIKPRESTEIGLSGNNFEEALLHASDILKKWRNDNPDSYPREQAVLIISDGDMANEKFGANFEQTISNLGPIVDPSSEFLPASVSIFHIGVHNLDPDAGMTDFWSIGSISDFWKKTALWHSGDLIILDKVTVKGNQDIDAKVSAALNSVLGSDLGAANCNGTGEGIDPIWIEPYHNNFLVLYVYRFGAAENNSLAEVAVTINVTKADGTSEIIRNGINQKNQENTLDGHQFAFIPEGPNDRYIFYRPPAGKYSITIEKANPCKDISILTGTRGVTASLISPVNGKVFTENDVEPYYDQSAPVKFAFNLWQMDENGKLMALKEIDEYPIRAKVLVRRQGSSEEIEYPVKLKDVASALYESTTPISFQFTGKYSWELVVETNNPRASDPQNPISNPIYVTGTEGEFEVTPLMRDFNIKPVTNIPDSELFSDKMLDQKISFQIQVIDQSGKALRSDLRISEPNQFPFIARLVLKNTDQSITEIDRKEMIWKEGNTYSVDLKPRSGGQFQTGTYQIVIGLTENYNKEIYIPGRNNSVFKEFTISVVHEQEFKWSLKNPESGKTYSIRKPLNWFAEPDKSQLLAIEAKGSESLLDSQSMLDPGGTASSLFTGQLKNVATGETYSLTFSPVPHTNLFVADWPAEAALKGDYSLKEVLLDANNLNKVYVDKTSETSFPVDFSFNEPPWAAPWSLLAALIFGAIILLAILLIYLNAGSLFDATVTFIPARGAQDPITGDVSLWKTFRTRQRRIPETELSGQLNGGSLVAIKVTAVKPTSPDVRVAANFELVFKDLKTETEDVLSITDVNEGEETLVGTGQRMILGKGSAGYFQRMVPVFMISLLLIIIWLAVFSILYLMA